MKRNLYLFPVLTTILIFLQVTSCKKETTAISPSPTICDVKGIYSGTSTRSTGTVSTMTYNLQDNNFAISSVTPNGTAVTFGGYRNTCDSVFISSYYTSNSSYYLLKGKLLNNGTTISGTYNNLTTPSDFGAFSISK
jgi:hypothetical protein